MKTGILLINLGTPKSPSKKSVRAFLKAFLSDPKVIDLPAPVRWLLLNTIILPFRTRKSAHAYQQIWTKEGSPLHVHSFALSKKLRLTLDSHYTVEFAMRYGQDTIKQALKNLRRQACEKIIILPLFPQYAEATTGSIMNCIFDELKNWPVVPHLDIINDFFSRPEFINASAAVYKEATQDFKPDYILFSYHGLPFRQITRAYKFCSRCDLQNACPSISANNRFCYRAQCYQTSRLLAAAMGLNENQYGTAFQSRLGRVQWTPPYTEEVLPLLAKQDIKNLAIACPAFIADCLETLEEIGIRAEQQWHELGGESFKLIPCVNEHDAWVTGLRDLLIKSASR